MQIVVHKYFATVLFSFFLLAIPFLSYAQAGSYNFRRFTPNDGLSDGVVHAIAQDRYGFIWIGTSYGINRFDGVNAKSFFSKAGDSTTLTDNYVQAIYSDSRGNLWVGTLKGLCRFDYVSGTFINYPSPKEVSVYDIQEDKKGNLWLATGRGLWQVDSRQRSIHRFTHNGDTVFQKKFDCTIRKMVASPGGDWYLASHCGIKIFNPQSFRYDEIKHDPSAKFSISGNVVYTIALDSVGNLWAGCAEPKPILNKIDLRHRTVKRYDRFLGNQKQLSDITVLDILADRSGRLWIVTSNSGLSLYNKEKDIFDDYRHDPLLPNSILADHNLSLYQDANGIIWVGSAGYGFSYFNPDKNIFTTLHPSLDKKNSIPGSWCRAACEDREGHLWLGTGSGLARYNRRNQTFKIFANEDHKKPVLYSNSVRSLLEDDEGDIWIGTAKGLNRYRSATGTIDFFDQAHGMPLSFFWMLAKGKDGEVWIGSTNGLFRYLRKENRFDNLQEDPLLAAYARNNIQALFVDSRNRLWAGLHSVGIFMFDPARKEVRLLKVKDSLVLDTRTSSFAEDKKGIIWIGSEEGITAYDPENNCSRMYTRDDGLPSNRTNNLMVDSLDRLWIGTSNGLCLLDTNRQGFRRFGVVDGLLTNQFNSQAAYRTRDGIFIFPMFSGFLAFKPEAYRKNSLSAPVYITSFRVENKKIETHTNPESLDHVNLGHDQNFFAMELAGLHYMNPAQCVFAYKLEGFDKDWNYSTKREISYTNVPAGNYVFHYKVMTDSPSIPVPEKTLAISISTVFYKTWWFRSLVVGIIMAALLSFYIYRTRQREKIFALQSKAQSLEKEKAVVQYENLKQQLNPHFLFNSLTSLKSLIRIDKNNASVFLEKMSATYRYILKTSEKELVTLREEIDFLQTYIDLQQARFGKGLQVNIQIREGLESRKIAPVTLQNLLENAIKHNLIDKESPLIVDIFDEEDYLVIRNNLQPKDFVETSNQYGLKHMQSLYHYLETRPMRVWKDQHHFIVKIPLL